MGENYFELNIPPFVGLHPMFNVDLLQPFFPRLFDTSQVEKQFTPTEINPNYLEHASTDHIMEAQVKGTRHHKFHLYHVVKLGQLLHQRKWLIQGQI
jgi:hypothetical protein